MRIAKKPLWIVAAVASILVIASFLNDSGDEAAAPAAEEPTVKVVTITPSPTATGTPTPSGTDPPEPAETATPSPISGEKPKSAEEHKLVKNAQKFLEAYYTVPPDASERSMRAAVKKAAVLSPQFLESVYFKVEEKLQERNQVRWREHLTLLGRVRSADVLVRKTGTHVYTVESLVAQVTLDKDGEVQGTEIRPEVTVWSIESGQWTLLGFGDHNQGPGGEG